MPQPARCRGGAYAVRTVDVAAVFLTEFRALAAERGQGWGKILLIDARFGETGRMSPGLASYLRSLLGPGE